MKQVSMIALTKLRAPGSIFVNVIAFSVKQSEIDNLTSGDLFLTSDLKGVIDFFVFYIDPNKMQQTRTKSDIV